MYQITHFAKAEPVSTTSKTKGRHIAKSTSKRLPGTVGNYCQDFAEIAAARIPVKVACSKSIARRIFLSLGSRIVLAIAPILQKPYKRLDLTIEPHI